VAWKKDEMGDGEEKECGRCESGKENKKRKKQEMISRWKNRKTIKIKDECSIYFVQRLDQLFTFVADILSSQEEDFFLLFTRAGPSSFQIDSLSDPFHMVFHPSIAYSFCFLSQTLVAPAAQIENRRSKGENTKKKVDYL